MSRKLEVEKLIVNFRKNDLSLGQTYGKICDLFYEEDDKKLETEKRLHHQTLNNYLKTQATQKELLEISKNILEDLKLFSECDIDFEYSKTIVLKHRTKLNQFILRNYGEL